TGRLVCSVRLFETANPVVWPILGATLLAVCVAVPKYYAAFLKQDHDTKRLKAGLLFIPGVAGFNLLAGIYGYWLGLYPVARQVATEEADALTLVFRWMMRGSAMFTVCLLCVMVIIVLWFVLTNKIARIEQAEAASLMAD
ncbi:MAG: hypothetical protein KJ645_02435, partial [Planctomycetes bacterium]|nr:hypothetical protein [Planctomycetota bacterium]